MRDATSEEAAADYVKREEALERGIAEGLYSDKQAEQLRESLKTFSGYPRPS